MGANSEHPFWDTPWEYGLASIFLQMLCLKFVVCHIRTHATELLQALCVSKLRAAYFHRELAAYVIYLTTNCFFVDRIYSTNYSRLRRRLGVAISLALPLQFSVRKGLRYNHSLLSPDSTPRILIG